MGRRYVWASVILILPVLMFGGCAWKKAESRTASEGARRTIYYFYESVCASCVEEGAFYVELSGQLNGQELPEGWSVRCVNVFREGDELYHRVCEEQGVPQGEAGLPMLAAPAGVAVGEREISDRMRELIYDSCGVPATVWYYQRPDCKDCQQVSGIIREAAAAHPQYLFIEIDTNDAEEKENFKQLLRDLGIPQEKWEVPFLYDGRQWLSGCESIEAGLDTIFAEE